MNAFTEAAKTNNQDVEFPILIQSFLTGKTAKSGSFQSLGGVLYDEKKVIARRCFDGSILLSTENIEDSDLNDALIGSLYVNGVDFRRLNNFNSLLSAVDRVNDIKNGRFDDFRAIARLVEFPVSEEDISAVERAKTFIESVDKFFKKAEERERLARVKAEAIDWDNGTGAASNAEVHGSGGGARLRVSINKRYRVPTVETSKGHTLSVTRAKLAWDFASKYWHGGVYLPSYGESRGSNGGYRIEVQPNHLHFGCQKVTKEEAERFAAVMEWPRKEKKVKK